jgi:hypothetical protein
MLMQPGHMLDECGGWGGLSIGRAPLHPIFCRSGLMLKRLLRRLFAAEPFGHFELMLGSPAPSSWTMEPEAAPKELQKTDSSTGLKLADVRSLRAGRARISSVIEA